MRRAASLKAGRSIPSYPSLGRFLSQDPISFAGGLNLYSYGNSPVTTVDPAGLNVFVYVGEAIWAGIESGAAEEALAWVGSRLAEAYAGTKIWEHAPPAEVFAAGLPMGAASASTDFRYLSRPWDDASIYGPGRYNMAMSKKDGDCPEDLPSLTGKSLNAGKKLLDKAGLKEQKGQRKNGGRAWYDKKGRIRAGFDFAGKIWGEHWHKWNTKGNPTDDHGNIYTKHDPEAHIPAQGNSVKKKR